MASIKPRVPVLQRGHPLARGLRLFWAMSGVAGPTLADAGPERDSGTLFGTTPRVAGPSGDARSFASGTSSYAVNSKSLSLPRVTIAGRMRVPTLPGAQGTLCGFSDGIGSGTQDKTVYLDASNKLIFYVYDGGVKNTAAPASAVPANTWFSFAATADGTTARTYQDGTEVGNVACGTTFTGYSVPNFIAAGYGSHGNCPGVDFDWIAVWDRALSSSEVSRLNVDPFALVRPARSPINYLKAAIPAAGGVTVTPPTLALTTATFAPVVAATANVVLTPTTLALTSTGFAPTVTVTANVAVTPPTLALVTSAFAPTVSVSANVAATPATLALTLTAFAPTVGTTANVATTPTTAALTLSAFAPTVSSTSSQVVTPATLALTTTTFAPTVSATANVTVTPPTLTLVTTGFAPIVTAASGLTVTPPTLSLATATFAPTVTATANVTATPATLPITLSAFAPSVSVSSPGGGSSPFRSRLISGSMPGGLISGVA
jgi:hypothetical protein